MRTIAVARLTSLLIVTLPIVAAAQANIQSAFDAIIKCPDVRIVESHSLEKDPVTNKKTGQSDVYRFTLPANRTDLLKNVIAAFDKDSESAYSIKRGGTVNTESDIILAVGNDNENGVHIDNIDGEYIYALFLPPESESDSDKYRYAYGMNCGEKDGKLVGKLVITYATTLKYRQEQEQKRQLNMFRSFSNGAIIIPSVTNNEQQTWFDILMSYFQSMTSANTQTRIALATKAYKHICNLPQYGDVSENDKNAAREILKGMLSDRKYSESVLNNLLNQCLIGIK